MKGGVSAHSPTRRGKIVGVVTKAPLPAARGYLAGNDIRPRTEHIRGALQIVAGVSDRGRHAEPAVRVTGGKRVPAVVEEILRRDQPELTAASTTCHDTS
jgi:hypothetical protein